VRRLLTRKLFVSTKEASTCLQTAIRRHLAVIVVNKKREEVNQEKLARAAELKRRKREDTNKLQAKQRLALALQPAIKAFLRRRAFSQQILAKRSRELSVPNQVLPHLSLPQKATFLTDQIEQTKRRCCIGHANSRVHGKTKGT
jgi:hypothetical protein